jgi:hypothetical protein
MMMKEIKSFGITCVHHLIVLHIHAEGRRLYPLKQFAGIRDLTQNWQVAETCMLATETCVTSMQKKVHYTVRQSISKDMATCSCFQVVIAACTSYLLTNSFAHP